MGPELMSDIAQNFHDSFVFDKSTLLVSNTVLVHLELAIKNTLLALTPFFLLMLLVAILAPVLLGGWVFTLNNIVPKPEKLNPIKGLTM